jgi:hypothetical protein
MAMNTTLDAQEQKWLLEPKITRVSDSQEVLIYPMGAERFLSQVLFGDKQERYNIRSDIEGKNVLVIPGYGNSAFLFAAAGAKSVTVYDKDPVTIAWVKAFKKYYQYRESPKYPSIGDILFALTCWYPPLVTLPKGKIRNFLCWAINPKALRRTYIHYMLSLVQRVIQSQDQGDYEWDKEIQFNTGELNDLVANKEPKVFDTAFVPYLLGVRNGIETEKSIVDFMRQLVKIVPKGHIVVSPIQDTKEFHFIGQRYFETTGRANIQSIPELTQYIIEVDSDWFKPQGLVVFGMPIKQ